MKNKLAGLIGIGKEFGGGLGDRKLTLYSASGTYNIFMAIVPFITLLVSTVRFLPVTEEEILSQMGEVLPEQVMSFAQSIISGIYRNGSAAFTISIVLTVWSASACMRAIMKGLDSAYDAGDISQNTVIYYARSVLYMVVLVPMFLLSFILLAYGGKILDGLLRYLPDSGVLEPVFTALRYLRFLPVLLLLFLIFLLAYRFMPKRHLPLKAQLPGAAFAALAWVVFSLGFSWYVSFSDKFGVYGSIGTVMVAMMWFYYCIFFLLIGGWLNRWLSLRKEKAE